VSMNMPLQVGQRHAPPRPRRPSDCMTAPSFGHFHSVCASSVMTCPSVGLPLADVEPNDQPTQRTSGSLRATGAGTAVG
jgi:hypothetical protein